MSVGELKKRILDKRDSLCWCGGEIADKKNPDYKSFKTCKIKREPTKEEITEVLNEAAKEFPKTPINCIEDMTYPEEVRFWFKKWFGKEKSNHESP